MYNTSLNDKEITFNDLEKKFLLDEYLQMNTIGHISTTLVEKMIDNVTNVSYRNTAKNIKELTDTSLVK